MLVMEDPQLLLDRVLAFAAGQDGIVAVVQTGSRARERDVDVFSDLDIELIGPGASSLVGDDGWQQQIAPVMITLHLANEVPGSPDWPTCLVVFAQGRKIDFTLAGTRRLERLAEDGLDSIYSRGYVVHFDRTGLTERLAPPSNRPAVWSRPSPEQFVANQRVFWFEATQVPIYAARGDLWPAMARLEEAREQLLSMLRWRAGAESDGAADTWYLGYHLHEWLDARTREQINELFPRYEREQIVQSLRAAIAAYTEASTATSAALHLPILDLRHAVEQHVEKVLALE